MFSYVCVWGDTSNMIFELNFCLATKHGRLQLQPESSWGNWKQEFISSSSKIAKLYCPLTVQCMWCQYSAGDAFSDKS